MSKLTIFERIIQGEIPAAKIYEDEKFIAILDVMPVVPGHTLVIPKKPAPYLFELDDKIYLELMQLSKRIANHLQKKLGCKRVCMTVIGWEVPHVHVHLIPTTDAAQLPLSGPERKKASSQELLELSEKLRFPR